MAVQAVVMVAAREEVKAGVATAAALVVGLVAVGSEEVKVEAKAEAAI